MASDLCFIPIAMFSFIAFLIFISVFKVDTDISMSYFETKMTTKDANDMKSTTTVKNQSKKNIVTLKLLWVRLQWVQMLPLSYFIWFFPLGE